jgi:hypothetical protein
MARECKMSAEESHTWSRVRIAWHAPKRGGSSPNSAASTQLRDHFHKVAGRPLHGPIVALTPTDPDPVVLDDILVLTWKPGRGPNQS